MIIGLFGPTRAGKNSVSSILVEEFGFINLSISEPFKSLFHQLVGHSFEDHQKDHPQKEINGLIPRDGYIDLGRMEKYNRGMWVNRMLENVRDPNQDYVIESVGNQSQWTHIVKFQLVRNIRLIEVTRPGFEWTDNRTPVTDRLTVPVIDNNGGVDNHMDKLRVKVYDTMTHLRTHGGDRNYSADISWIEAGCPPGNNINF